MLFTESSPLKLRSVRGFLDIIGRDPSISDANRWHVDVFPFSLLKVGAYSTDFSRATSKFYDDLNFNRSLQNLGKVNVKIDSGRGKIWIAQKQTNLARAWQLSRIAMSDEDRRGSSLKKLDRREMIQGASMHPKSIGSSNNACIITYTINFSISRWDDALIKDSWCNDKDRRRLRVKSPSKNPKKC